MIDRQSEVHKVTSISARVSRVVEFPIPVLQAKFYYIPPLEGRFQTFWGIDMRFNSPLQRLSCMILNYGGNEIMLYKFPTSGELKFHIQYTVESRVLTRVTN